MADLVAELSSIYAPPADSANLMVIPAEQVKLDVGAQSAEIAALPTTKTLTQLAIAGVPARKAKGEEDASAWTTKQSRENAVQLSILLSEHFGSAMSPLPGSFIRTGAKPWWMRSWPSDPRHLTAFIVLSPEGIQLDYVPLSESACTTIRENWIARAKPLKWATDDPKVPDEKKMRAQFVANPRFTTALKAASANRTVRLDLKQGDVVVAQSGVIFLPVGDNPQTAFLQSFRFVPGLDAWAWSIWDKLARQPIFDPAKEYPEGEFVSYAYLSDADPLPVAPPKEGEPHFAPEPGWILDLLGPRIPKPLLDFEAASATVRQQAANPNSPGYKSAFARLLAKMENAFQNLDHYQKRYVQAFLGEATALYEHRIAGIHAPPELVEERNALSTLWNRFKTKTPENIYKNAEGPKQVDELIAAIHALAPKMPLRGARSSAAAVSSENAKALFVQRAQEGLAEMQSFLLETGDRQVAADLNWLEQELSKPVSEQQEWTQMRRVYDELMKRFNPNYEGGALPMISATVTTATEARPAAGAAASKSKPKGKGGRKRKSTKDDDDDDDVQIDLNGDPMKMGWDLVNKGLMFEVDMANLRPCHCCGQIRVLFMNHICQDCVFGVLEELMVRALKVAKSALEKKKGIPADAKKQVEAKIDATRKLYRQLSKMNMEGAFELVPEGLADQVSAIFHAFIEVDTIMSQPPIGLILRSISTRMEPEEDSYDPMEESFDVEGDEEEGDEVDDDDDEEGEGEDEEEDAEDLIAEDEADDQPVVIAIPPKSKRSKAAPTVPSNLSEQTASAILNFECNVVKVREKLDDWKERWAMATKSNDEEEFQALLGEIKRETPKWDKYWMLRIVWDGKSAICDSVGPWNNHNKALLAEREYQVQNPQVKAELFEITRAKH